MPKFVRYLGLCSSSERRRAKRDGSIPEDIPLIINRPPRAKGWADFLGPSYTGRAPTAPRVVAVAEVSGSTWSPAARLRTTASPAA